MPHIQEKLKAILSPTDENTTYAQLSEDLKENLGAVLEFFLNEELVHKYISKFADDYEQFDSKEDKKTLRRFFTQWGSGNGFNQGDNRENTQYPLQYKHSGKIYKLSQFQLPKEIPSLVGILPSSLFTRVFLGFGYLICDPGAGTVHGKWTHSLQLFMLEEAHKNNELKFINCTSIVNLMREIFSA
ncbi:LirA/MavJ family T4SS effector [Legionella longbeachae]|uniref:LirA/MavJ family T4SS effector n=1 Tax=Legionella longbeachae TaxID=450 RepID=UPI001CD9B8BC|nr:LirA/MavJ family T4SS effector [Legionella longbeachae]